MGRKERMAKEAIKARESLDHRKRRFLGIGLAAAAGVIAMGVGYRLLHQAPVQSPQREQPISGSPKQYSPLERLAQDKHPSIQRVELHLEGKRPPIIYIPWTHDSSVSEPTDAQRRFAQHYGPLMLHLHDAYGIIHLAHEAITTDIATKLMEGRKQILAEAYSGRKLVLGQVERVLNDCRWTLAMIADAPEFPLDAYGSRFNKDFQEVIAMAAQKGWLTNEDAFNEHKQELTLEHIHPLVSQYNHDARRFYNDDPELSRSYRVQVIERDAEYIRALLVCMNAGGRGGIIVMGMAHTKDLIDQFRQQGRAYIIVVPTGLEWKPEMDEEKLREKLAFYSTPNPDLEFNIPAGQGTARYGFSMPLLTYEKFKESRK